MYVRRVWRRRPGRDSEGPGVVGRQRISVWTTIVGILVVDLVLQNRSGALLVSEEVYVWCDHINFATARYSRVVVQSGRGATDVEPVPDDIDRFCERDGQTRIAWSIDAVVAGIGVKDQWSKLNDGC